MNASPSHASGGGPPPAGVPLLDPIDQITTAATALLARVEAGATTGDMATAVDKATSALRFTADFSKLQLELEKMKLEAEKLRRDNLSAPRRERSEKMRDYLAMLTPLITIMTLAATLIAQNWQFLASEKTKREAAVDVQWQEAVKVISQTGALSPGVIALQPFLNSPKYDRQAREVAVGLLGNSTDTVFFHSLYGSAFGAVDWRNLGYLVQLSRTLHSKIAPLWSATWDPERSVNDATRLNPKQLELFDYVNTIVPVVAAQIGSLLKTPRPDGTVVDLSATFFSSGEWNGVNLSGANLEGARITYITLLDADLRDVRAFNGAVFHATAWWEAKTISRELLDYLAQAWPHDPRLRYGPRGVLIQPADYESALRRLRAQPK